MLRLVLGCLNFISVFLSRCILKCTLHSISKLLRPREAKIAIALQVQLCLLTWSKNMFMIFERRNLATILAWQVRAVSTEDVKEELTLLDKAVSSILLQRTIDRNLVLVAGAKARLTKQQQGSREEKGEKPAKPEDLVRLYDILYQVNIPHEMFRLNGALRRDACHDLTHIVC